MANFQIYGTFIDPRDGKTYKTIQIGEQVWLAENFCYNAKGSKSNANTPATAKYGRLYTWEAAVKACPKGWHLPTNEEWETLINFAGGVKIAGKKLKSKTGWNPYKGKTGNGTDALGFTAYPSGLYFKTTNPVPTIGRITYWWSQTEANEEVAYLQCLEHQTSHAHLYHNIKTTMFSVRYVRDNIKETKC